MPAQISICVPNLNTRPFLEDRFSSIFSQTTRNWDLFVYDSRSDDGAWEYLQSLASHTPQMRLAQGPREGPYPAWNRCIASTLGEYVYIATSDDTMAHDCLAKLSDALDRHPDCDIAHCPLRVIDAEGRAIHSPCWPEATVFAEGLPTDACSREHIRRAPYDGLLHLTGKHVVLSITQILIRRRLFEKIGYFHSTWGSVSDFHWEMRAGLAANMIHVPDTWASWRVHPKQITVTNLRSPERDERIQAMIDDALAVCEPLLPPHVRNHEWFRNTKLLRDYYGYLDHGRSVRARRLHQVKRILTGPNIIRTELLRQVSGRVKWPTYAPGKIRHFLESKGLSPISFT